jgi:hypothetical protein
MTNDDLAAILAKPTTSPTKAAEAMGIGKNRVRDAIEAGAIETIETGGKRKRVTTAWLRRKLGLDGEAANAPAA